MGGAALWRYFHLRDYAKNGLTDAEDLHGIDTDFEMVRKYRNELCPGLGSPVALIRDIREKAICASDGPPLARFVLNSNAVFA